LHPGYNQSRLRSDAAADRLGHHVSRPRLPQDLRLHASLNRSLLRVVWFPRVDRIPGGRACKGLEGTVQNDMDYGALLPGTDGYTESEVLGDCWVHNVIPRAIFPLSSGILPGRNR